MSPLARHIFNVHDDPLLNYLKDDNQKIEPEWYMPIIPMILVNGADGIGTGWMTKIPNFRPEEVVENLKRLLDGREMKEMTPWFKGFRGVIQSLDADNQRYVVSGEVANISDTKIEITELPVRTWTQTYKEQVMEPYLNGSEKLPAVIQDYKEYHTDKTVKFVVQMGADKMRAAETQKGLHQFFKLQTTIATSSMVLFDANGCLRKYNSPLEIMQEFYDLRLKYYAKRKDYLEGMLEAEALKLTNQARFILEKCDGTLTVENKRKKAMIDELQRKNYDSDPVRKWKRAQLRAQGEADDDEASSEEDETSVATAGEADYDYLLGMPLWSLTQERKEDLLKKKGEKKSELRKLKETTKEDMWRSDLDAFMEKLREVEKKEAEDDIAHLKKEEKKMFGAAKSKKGKHGMHADVLPSPVGIRVEPRIPDELRAKAAKAAAAKDKSKEKKKGANVKEEEERDEFDMMCDDKDLNVSLSEKLGVDSKGKKGKKKKGFDSSSDEDDGEGLFAGMSGSDSDDDGFKVAPAKKY